MEGTEEGREGVCFQRRAEGAGELVYVSLISTHCVQELNSSSRYRYQLEAFVDKVKGREPRDWVTGEDSIKNMECLDMVYEKVSHFDPLRSQ